MPMPKIWSIVEPTLSPHNRNFASNIELLRKSKEDSQIDAALRRAMDGSQSSFTPDLDSEVPADLDLFDGEEALDTLLEDFSTETLIAAYHSVARSWYKKVSLQGDVFLPYCPAGPRLRSCNWKMSCLSIFDLAPTLLLASDSCLRLHCNVGSPKSKVS
jgi:hypothetical protein